ncbi:Hypothetical predicted protein [Paramuricea clavata]|uniref:Uncharacterized protein n=1 Tax=Paramuricea clavata TaxID=317549 RepID=A0A6S7FYW0_PARCT|nr:Hypothetical predicted protein [Paramuricea clavata]
MAIIKFLDSHSRDIYGRSHPQGTCVLLEAPNINNVIQYFQSLYNENSQFEVRAINIEEVQANSDQNLNKKIRNSALSGNASEESETYDDDDSSPTCTAHYIKNIKDKHTLVDTIFSLVTTKIEDEIVNYEIQFLSCSSELSNCERKRIMKNHRQSYINDFIEPALKKHKLETKQMKYKTMAQEKKQKILEKKRKYEKLDKSKKE